MSRDLDQLVSPALFEAIQKLPAVQVDVLTDCFRAYPLLTQSLSDRRKALKLFKSDLWNRVKLAQMRLHEAESNHATDRAVRLSEYISEIRQEIDTITDMIGK